MTGVRTRWLGALLAFTGALLLAGCYDEPGVTFYEAGEYKGPSDPLLGKLDDQELRAQLEQRFTRTQTYR